MASAYPDEVAYRNLGDGASITFGRWERESNRLARGLQAKGVRKGDLVAIDLEAEQILDFIVTYSAVHKIGAVSVPMNNRLSPPEMRAILEHAEVTAVVCSGAFEDAVAPLSDSLASLAVVATVGPSEHGRFADLEEVKSEDADAIQVPIDDDDLADVMYTSGTTGTAERGCRAARQRRHAAQRTSDVERIEVAHRHPGLHLRRPRLHLQPDEGGHDRAVPAQVRRRAMARHRRARAAGDRLRGAGHGQAPDPPSRVRLGRPVQPEAAHPGERPAFPGHPGAPAGPAARSRRSEQLRHDRRRACHLHDGSRGARTRPGAVGGPRRRWRCASSTTRERPAHRRGRRSHHPEPRGHREYYKNPEATARMWEGGWLHTGDLGYLDADGYLYIVGRKKEMVVRGGMNVYADDVEAVLQAHPEVVEAAVIGIPHEVLGEDIAAYVVLRPGATVSTAELQGFAGERLADYKVPRRVDYLAALPRNAGGKVLKSQLAGVERHDGREMSHEDTTKEERPCRTTDLISSSTARPKRCGM